MTYRNGNTYDGGWKDNLEDGTGTYKYMASETVYEGKFVNGQRTDPDCEITWKSKTTYKGPIVEGMMQTEEG